MLRRLAWLAFMLPLAMSALAILAAGGVAAQEASPGVSAEPSPPPGSSSAVVLTANGIVDNVMAGYLAEGVAQAEREGAAVVVIQLNTPGGSLDATQRIVSTLLEAPLPTIVWVTPSGARAASAGTFITLASHIAMMAPGTNIGAATPVGGQGEDIEGDLGQKVLNDAVASIRSIAETRGRNADWAEQTVRDARSSPATEALEVGAIDGIAGSLADVLAFADGRTVTVNGQSETLAVADATPAALGMNPFQEFLHLLSDPNISFILFTIGFYGLLFELQNPNFVTGILGALAIILAFIGFGSLPLNVAGLLLILLAMVLIGLELTVTSHGLLGLGGIICFALGASALFTQPGDPFEPLVRVSVPVIATTTVTAGIFLVLIVTFAIRSREMPAPVDMVGSAAALAPGVAGVVRRPIEPLGSVYVAGEEWSARTVDGQPLDRGVPVRVVSTDGLTVIVEPDPSSSSQA